MKIIAALLLLPAAVSARVGGLKNLNLTSSYCTSDMSNLESVAYKDSKGNTPDGMCYSHVADYIDSVGYGGIDKGGFDDAIPSQYWTYAYQFAEYLNTGNNAANLCLKNIQSSVSNNPYNAPSGAIVVVRAGTPGTANPVAGDIAVANPDDFYNGGMMGYGGSSNFPSSNDYVLGIYVPTSCTGSCGSSGWTTTAARTIQRHLRHELLLLHHRRGRRRLRQQLQQLQLGLPNVC